jgi:hypothetical protein
MVSTRHPPSFRRAFVDALSLCHTESVVLRRSDPDDPESPLVPVRSLGAGRKVGSRTVWVNGFARQALALDYTTALNGHPQWDYSGRHEPTGIPWDYGYGYLDTPGAQGNPHHAAYFCQRSPGAPFPHPVGGAVARSGTAGGGGGNAFDGALALISEALETLEWLDVNVFTPLDPTLAAEARAAVANARADYLASLNARFGAEVYV